MADRIALQLYTLRDALAADFDGTLRRVASIGYRHVETAFFPEGVDARRAGDAIREAGLSVCAAHAPLPIGDDFDGALRLAQNLECNTLVWHGWPEDPRHASRDGVASLIADYNAAGAVARDHGLRLGFHNHWWEFRPMDGVRPFDLLVDRLAPDLFFEIDTYWALAAGVDPVALVRRLGPRAPLVHLKDGPADLESPKTALGDGNLPLSELLEALSSETWRIVELDDCASDLFDAVARSRDRLNR